MFFAFSVTLFLALMAVGYELGIYVTPWYLLASLVASPLLSGAFLLSIAFLADWSERRARAKRRALGAARRSQQQ
ncbi:hypothetical protein D3C84_1266440 [compost metagenome]